MKQAEKEFWHTLKDTPVGLKLLIDEFVGLGVKAMGLALVAVVLFFIAYLYDQPLILIPGVAVAFVFISISAKAHAFSEMIEANPHYRAAIAKTNARKK